MSDIIIPRLAGIYAASKPNEIEQRLQQQRQPGYIAPGLAPWALAHLPSTDPRKLAALRAMINKEEIDLEQILHQQ